MIIDVHTHLYESNDSFPTSMLDSVFAKKGREFEIACKGDQTKAKQMLAEYKKAFNIQGTVDSMIRDMDAAGVDKSVAMPLDYGIIYDEEAKISVWELNEYIADAQKRYPDRIIGFAGIDPLRKDALQLLDRCVRDLGLKGMKIYPCCFSPEDERIQDFLARLNEMEMPCLFHQGSAFNPCVIDYGNPSHLDALTVKYPKLKMIAAHFAKGWEEVLLGTILYKGAWIGADISGFQYYELQMSPWHFLIQMRYLMDKIPNLLMMGSDWPMHIGAAYLSHKQWFDAVRNLKIPKVIVDSGLGMRDFSQEEKDKVLGENARRFLNIK